MSNGGKWNSEAKQKKYVMEFENVLYFRSHIQKTNAKTDIFLLILFFITN